MKFLKANQTRVNYTLLAENMQLEHIFSITLNDTLYLCWYSNQTAPSRPVEESTDPIDRKHLAFWDECIDDSKPTVKFKLENTFTPPITSN